MGLLLSGLTFKRVNDQIACEVRKSLCPKVLNPTNGSWWMVQILSRDDANKNLLTLCAEDQLNPLIKAYVFSNSRMTRFS